MLTFGLVVVIKVFVLWLIPTQAMLPMVGGISLPPLPTTGMLVVLLLSAGWTTSADIKSGTIGRCGLLVALGVWFGSFGELLPALNAIYLDSSPALAEMLAAAVLLVFPAALMLPPLIVTARRLTR